MAMAVSVPYHQQNPANNRFILEGIPTVIVGVAIWFCLPDYPETAKWLTEEERAHAIERMGPYAPKGTDKHFDKRDFINTIKSVEFWLFAIAYFLMAYVYQQLSRDAR